MSDGVTTITLNSPTGDAGHTQAHTDGVNGRSPEQHSPSFLHQKFTSCQDLSTSSVTSPQQVRNERFLTPTSPSFSGMPGLSPGPEFGHMTPGSSVPCFRRYAHRPEDGSDWDEKRRKMREYQMMLDQQTAEIARRKQEEIERRRKEEQALERRLKDQRERMRMEFEEEQKRLKEREILMEQKRQDVIRALEKQAAAKAAQDKSRRPCPDTLSLMSVDAVIGMSPRSEELPVKRAQSMYEVTSCADAPEEQKEKTFSDIAIQTDYSLLLSWLFNMNDNTDWQSFLQQRDAEKSATRSASVLRHEEPDKRSVGTMAPVSAKVRPLVPDSSVSSSQTNSSPHPTLTPVRMSRVDAGTSTSFRTKTSPVKPLTSHHPRSMTQVRSRCKWNLSASGPKAPLVARRGENGVKVMKDGRQKQAAGGMSHQSADRSEGSSMESMDNRSPGTGEG